jgi:5-methylcytosine-specific restriction protein B
MALADLTSADAVRAAIAEHDAIGQERFLRRYGYADHFQYVVADGDREYPAKAILGAAHGFQHPQRGPLPHTAFNGGSQTNDKLASLGFVVRPRATGTTDADKLGAVLARTMVELGSDTPELGTVRRLVTVDGPGSLAGLLDERWVTHAGAGRGSAADVPWFSVQPERGRASARRGFYVVYLFAADGSAVYLSLNQGTENVKGGRSPLVKRAIDLAVAGGVPDDGELIELRSRAQRPRNYEAANAYAIRYAVDEVPDGATLAADLDRMLGYLDRAVASGLELDPESEPLHLLFKWSSDIEAQTIERHQAVADDRGAVWWGKFGTSGTPMSPRRLVELNEQLAAGVTTYAFLYGGGRTVRTRLRQIELDPAAVDAERMAGYYAKDDCTMFVLLEDFRPLPPGWPLDHLLLANDPNPAKVQGALSNQTTLLYVYERFVPGTRDDAIHVAAPQRELTREWLVEQTYWPEELLDELLAAIHKRGQVILAGPPGTGKTWVADQVARYLTQDEPGQIRTVQFHPSYGYEEFVEGLRPVVQANGAVTFDLRPGVVRQMATQMETTGATHVLVVDEVNRANVPRVFGELLYMLEYRDTPLTLQHSDQTFELPGRLKLVATMNTADLSTRSVDVALRRRFSIFECLPDADVLQRYYEDPHHTTTVDELVEGFVELNTELESLLDRHHTIGHSFFMDPEHDADHLGQTWRRQIQPLIEDYFFDRPEVAKELTLEKFWSSVA